MLWFKPKTVFEHYVTSEAYPKVSPSKQFIPEWYKKLPMHSTDTRVPLVRLPHKKGVKACVAFLDAFTTGYMLSTPVDIAVEQTEKGPSVSWSSSDVTVVDARIPMANISIPVPKGCYPTQFAWKLQTGFKIPKGYSAAIVHPLNRYDLPFVTLNGVLDGEFVMHPGNLPVYFDSNFEGIIPAGTPFAQVLLFKRENWKRKYSPNLLKEASLNSSLAAGIDSWYKKNFWKKKQYD
jgi:hypothetical protein